MGFISLKSSPGTGMSSWRSTRSTCFQGSTPFHSGSLANRARNYSTAMYVARWKLRLRMSTDPDACSTALKALYISRRGGGWGERTDQLRLQDHERSEERRVG